MSKVDQLEREVARQLDIANSFTRAQAKMEERKAATQAATLVRKQAKEQVKTMLNNPDLNHQTPLQVKLQSEQLTKRFDDQMVEVNALLASIPGGKPIIKAVKATASAEVTNATHNTITELADENYLHNSHHQHDSTHTQQKEKLK